MSPRARPLDPRGLRPASRRSLGLGDLPPDTAFGATRWYRPLDGGLCVHLDPAAWPDRVELEAAPPTPVGSVVFVRARSCSRSRTETIVVKAAHRATGVHSFGDPHRVRSADYFTRRFSGIDTPDSVVWDRGSPEFDRLVSVLRASCRNASQDAVAAVSAIAKADTALLMTKQRGVRFDRCAPEAICEALTRPVLRQLGRLAVSDALLGNSDRMLYEVNAGNLLLGGGRLSAIDNDISRDREQRRAWMRTAAGGGGLGNMAFSLENAIGGPEGCRFAEQALLAMRCGVVSALTELSTTPLDTLVRRYTPACGGEELREALRDARTYLTEADPLRDSRAYIRTGGTPVSVGDTEWIVSRLEEVREAVAVGVPDEWLGERLAVVASLRPGDTLTLDAVQARFGPPDQQYLAPRLLVTVKDVPHTSNGRPDYERARQLAAEAARGEAAARDRSGCPIL